MVTVRRVCWSTGRRRSFATWTMCSYPVRPVLGCWLFWASHLPSKLHGPAETPLDMVQPSQVGNGRAKANQQTQKVPPPSPEGAVPHHSAFGGSLGVSRLYPAPIISHFLSGSKQSMGHKDLSGREESLAEKWGMLLPHREMWWLTSWLGESRVAQSITGKGSGSENTTLHCSKSKNSPPV